METMFGIKIMTSEAAPVVKEQRRKHRKRRINKKWLKKYGYRAKDFDVFVVEFCGVKRMIMHPLALEKMKEDALAYSQSN
jgi:hypothetical protein